MELWKASLLWGVKINASESFDILREVHCEASWILLLTLYLVVTKLCNCYSFIFTVDFERSSPTMCWFEDDLLEDETDAEISYSLLVSLTSAAFHLNSWKCSFLELLPGYLLAIFCRWAYFASEHEETGSTEITVSLKSIGCLWSHFKLLSRPLKGRGNFLNFIEISWRSTYSLYLFFDFYGPFTF